MRTSFFVIAPPIPALPAAREYLQLMDNSLQARLERHIIPVQRSRTLQERLLSILAGDRDVPVANTPENLAQIQANLVAGMQELLRSAEPRAFVVGLNHEESDPEVGLIVFQVSIGSVASIDINGELRSEGRVRPANPFALPPTRPPVEHRSAWDWMRAVLEGQPSLRAQGISLADVVNPWEGRNIAVEFASGPSWSETFIPDASGAVSAKDIVPSEITQHGLRAQELDLTESMSQALFAASTFELTENEKRPDRTQEWDHAKHTGIADVRMDDGGFESMGFVIKTLGLMPDLIHIVLCAPCEEHGWHPVGTVRYVIPGQHSDLFRLSAVVGYLLERRGDYEATTSAVERLHAYFNYHGPDRSQAIQSLPTEPTVLLPASPLVPWRFEHDGLAGEMIPVPGGGFYFHREG